MMLRSSSPRSGWARRKTGTPTRTRFSARASVSAPVRDSASRPAAESTSAVTRTAPPPPRRREEVVDEPAELAVEIDVAVRPPDEGQLAVPAEAGPDPPARQVEGDREADDERPQREPHQPLARVPLGDEEGVLAE